MKKILFTLLLVLGISAAADAQVRLLDSSTDAVRKEAIAQDKLVFIDLYATWCGPCKAISPLVSKLAEEYDGKLVVGKCDVEQNEDITMEYAVRNIPTLLFFKDGKLVNKHVGAPNESKMRALFDKLL